MSDFRIINRRDDDECEAYKKCVNECGGCCPTLAEQEPEIIFSVGSIVKVRLTGEKAMILEVDRDSPVSYVLRLPNYQAVQFYSFEVEADV